MTTALAAAHAALFSLEGRIALVTGAARGIGLAIARGLAGAGARLVMADIEPAVMERAAELRQAGCSADGARCDVTREADVARLVDGLAPGGLDILVNNAAILVTREAAELDRPDWSRVIDTNLTACFFLAQAAAPLMARRGGGAVVNLSSIVGRVARAKLAAYIAAKAGIDGLTRALANEYAGAGIRVNAVAPGFIATDMAKTGSDAFDGWVGRVVPAGRWGRPEDIAATAVFLASPAASYITGQTVYVDGGFTAASRRT